ncbi:F-box only protein 40 isoform 1-T3 [Menidia menidia]
MEQNEQSQDVSEDVSAGISGSTVGVSRSSDSELIENGFAKMEQSEQSQEEIDALVKSRDMEGIPRPSEICEIFPKLMEEDVSDSTVGVSRELIENDFAKMEQNEQSQEEIDALVNSRDMGRIQKYSNWEKIFRKEKMGCNQTVKNLNNDKRQVEQNEVQTLAASKEENRDFKQEGEISANANANANARNEGGATGLAPWQDGVLERLGKEFNIGEYNMYLVHNGAMLINFGQLAACTPREKDFVYGNLEPIEVKTVHTFNVPSSYRAKRSHLKDPMSKAATKHQGVDTSDLGLTLEDIPKSDEVISTLLCSLEKEFKGHVISQSTWTDGIYVDVGTQTYNFPSAPFKEGASLADVVASKPRGLYIQIEAEPVTRRHNRNSSAFNFTCGHFFRRDEFRSHFRNAHSEIQAWFLQRCPLAYLGCTFSQTRFNPAGQQANIKFYPDTDSLSLVPSTYQGTVDPNIDTFSNLPFEVLQLVASYLDSFTLSQMSQVSQRMREVCATFLQERGMVSLQWRKKTYSHGGSSWKCWKKVWSFSTLFSPVEGWRIGDISSMSNHLKTCSFYQKEEHNRPVALACLQEVRDRFAESNLKR